MRIAAKDLETEATYKLITGIVVPRPIAWVTTLSPGGTVNLAPFSFFTCVSPKPPLLAISVGHKAGVYKDTARNILAREEYVIHIADFSHLEALHHTSTEYPPDISEVEAARLATLPSDEVGVPRLRDAPVAMECRFHTCIEFGDTRNRHVIVAAKSCSVPACAHPANPRCGRRQLLTTILTVTIFDGLIDARGAPKRLLPISVSQNVEIGGGYR
jgi:flavin reductase (DIM6/NTAB) family NADH-FMN oxidoreductase RutF